MRIELDEMAVYDIVMNRILYWDKDRHDSDAELLDFVTNEIIKYVEGFNYPPYPDLYDVVDYACLKGGFGEIEYWSSEGEPFEKTVEWVRQQGWITHKNKYYFNFKKPVEE